MNATYKQDKGFSIIEVVLVLAIVALIFIMIFIAWPALQRNQRDTARKNDASAVASAIGSYKGNRNGDITALTAATLVPYISSLSQYEVAAATFSFPAAAASVAGPANGNFTTMVVVKGAKCNSTADPIVATNAGANGKQVAILYRVEAGNAANGVVVCQDA